MPEGMVTIGGIVKLGGWWLLRTVCGLEIDK